jgi:hypothetical protein
MTGVGTIGTDTAIDDLLAEYYPTTPNSVLYELFENETAMLVGALLMETRGTSDGTDGADYHSERVTIAPDETEKVELDLVAKSVTLYNYGEPLEVAFKGPSTEHRKIPLNPADKQIPADFDPSSGLGTETVWIRNVGTAETNVQLVGWG